MTDLPQGYIWHTIHHPLLQCQHWGQLEIPTAKYAIVCLCEVFICIRLCNWWENICTIYMSVCIHTYLHSSMYVRVYYPVHVLIFVWMQCIICMYRVHMRVCIKMAVFTFIKLYKQVTGGKKENRAQTCPGITSPLVPLMLIPAYKHAL